MGRLFGLMVDLLFDTTLRVFLYLLWICSFFSMGKDDINNKAVV